MCATMQDWEEDLAAMQARVLWTCPVCDIFNGSYDTE